MDLTGATATPIGTIVPPLERVPVSNLRVVDNFGSTLDTVQVDQQVQVTADLTNGQTRDQAFAYLVQIQDEDNVTVHLAWISGSVAEGQSFSPSVSWTPAASGTYTATTCGSPYRTPRPSRPRYRLRSRSARQPLPLAYHDLLLITSGGATPDHGLAARRGPARRGADPPDGRHPPRIPSCRSSPGRSGSCGRPPLDAVSRAQSWRQPGHRSRDRAGTGGPPRGTGPCPYGHDPVHTSASADRPRCRGTPSPDPKAASTRRVRHPFHPIRPCARIQYSRHRLLWGCKDPGPPRAVIGPVKVVGFMQPRGSSSRRHRAIVRPVAPSPDPPRSHAGRRRNARQGGTPPGIAGILDDISGRIHIRDQAVPPRPHMKRRLPRSTRGPGLPGDPVPAGLPGMAAHGPSPASAPAPPFPPGAGPLRPPRPPVLRAPVDTRTIPGTSAGIRSCRRGTGRDTPDPRGPPSRQSPAGTAPPRCRRARLPRDPGAAARRPPAGSQVPPGPPADAPPRGPAAPRGSRARRTGPPRVFQGAGGPRPVHAGAAAPGPMIPQKRPGGARPVPPDAWHAWQGSRQAATGHARGRRPRNRPRPGDGAGARNGARARGAGHVRDGPDPGRLLRGGRGRTGDARGAPAAWQAGVPGGVGAAPCPASIACPPGGTGASPPAARQGPAPASRPCRRDRRRDRRVRSGDPLPVALGINRGRQRQAGPCRRGPARGIWPGIRGAHPGAVHRHGPAGTAPVTPPRGRTTGGGRLRIPRMPGIAPGCQAPWMAPGGPRPRPRPPESTPAAPPAGRGGPHAAGRRAGERPPEAGPPMWDAGPSMTRPVTRHRGAAGRGRPGPEGGDQAPGGRRGGINGDGMPQDARSGAVAAVVVVLPPSGGPPGPGTAARSAPAVTARVSSLMRGGPGPRRRPVRACGNTGMGSAGRGLVRCLVRGLIPATPPRMPR